MPSESFSIFHDLKHLLFCKTVEELTAAVGKLFTADIAIFNSTFQVLGSCRSHGFASEKDLIPSDGSYLSPNTKYFSALCNAFEKSRNLNNTTILRDTPDGAISVCKTIFDHNAILGYILLVTPTACYNDTLIYAAETMMISALKILQKDFLDGTDISIFLSELLQGKKIPQDIITQWLQQLNWDTGEYMYVIVIRNPVGKVLPPDVFRSFNIRDTDRALLFDGDLVWIMTQSKRLQGFDIERIAPLNQKLKEQNLYAGLSRRCPSMDHLHDSYKQAVCSLEKCIYDQDVSLRILPYIDTWLDDLLGEICTVVDLKKYCTPQLKVLEKYDKENNSDLLKTLTCYYDHNQSVKETAEYMFLHRNTVKYRLNKCEEILETDLNNMSRNIGIYFSLKVLNFLQNNPNK